MALIVVVIPILILRACNLLASDGLGYSGRRPWEFAVIGGFLFAGLLAVVFQQLAIQKGPTIHVLEDRLAHPHWRHPIFFHDIKQVTIEHTEFWGRKRAAVQLALTNGSTQLLPNLLLPTSPSRFAADVRAAIAQRHARDEPLS